MNLDHSQAKPRTLVIHHRSGIGDLIWHIPYFSAIAEHSANGKISLIARPSCKAKDVLAADAFIEEIFEFDRKPRKFENRAGAHDSLISQIQFFLSIRAKKFDRVYIFSNRLRYAALCMLAGIPKRAGFGFSIAERLMLNEPPFIQPHSGPGNWVYPEATQFAIAHGYVSAPVIPRMSVLKDIASAIHKEFEESQRTYYAFAIGTSEPRKDWGHEKFSELAQLLVERGLHVVLLGGPGEQKIAKSIIDRMAEHCRTHIQVFTQPSVQTTASVLRACAFCIGNDTGVLNMSTANGVPALGLFGCTPPLLHDPLMHSLTGDGMEAITPSDVIERLYTLKAPGLA